MRILGSIFLLAILNCTPAFAVFVPEFELQRDEGASVSDERKAQRGYLGIMVQEVTKDTLHCFAVKNS